MVKLVQICDQVQKLRVLRVATDVGANWNAVIKLIRKRKHTVVDQHKVLWLSVLYDAQVLDVNAFLTPETRISIHPLFEKLIFRVDHVNYKVCVALLCCCKDC